MKITARYFTLRLMEIQQAVSHAKGNDMGAAEQLMRRIVDDCAGCDCCRYLMDTNCLFFPKLYELWDREHDEGERITPEELRTLADLCNYCALCPCPDIRQDIITAKTLFIDRDGLAPYIRTLENVELVGKLCGTAPRLFNFLFQAGFTGKLIKKSTGIHIRRKLPLIPRQNFHAWARRRKLRIKPPESIKRKVVYFSGCTARYLFPDVARAAVEVLQRNGITVFYPEQHCCGMPSMLEGDRKQTLAHAARTVSLLSEVADDGYDIVTSCPTCGYMLKKALPEQAYYSEAYQDFVGGSDRYLKIPERLFSTSAGDGGQDTSIGSRLSFGGSHMMRETALLKGNGGALQEVPLRRLDKTMYGKIMRDDGYFSGIDPLKRIKVAEATYDLGEYLSTLLENGGLSTQLGAVSGRKVYYPPCHQREQAMGFPYLKLLGLIPGIALDAVLSSDFCCGIGGIMGFKRDFHNTSIRMGSRLMAKIKSMAPDHLVTDCLSCRLQFNQMSSYPVQHPVEILCDSYQRQKG